MGEHLGTIDDGKFDTATCTDCGKELMWDPESDAWADEDDSILCGGENEPHTPDPHSIKTSRLSHETNEPHVHEFSEEQELEGLKKDDPNRVHVPEDANDLKPGAMYDRDDLAAIFDLHDGLWGCGGGYDGPNGGIVVGPKEHELTPDLDCPNCVAAMKDQHRQMSHGRFGQPTYPGRCPDCPPSHEGHTGPDAVAHHTNSDQLLEQHPYWTQCGTCGGDGVAIGSTDVGSGEQKQKPCTDCGGIGEAYDAEYWDSDDQLHDFANYPSFRDLKIPDKSLKQHMKDKHGYEKGEDSYTDHQAYHGKGAPVEGPLADILLQKAAARQLDPDYNPNIGNIEEEIASYAAHAGLSDGEGAPYDSASLAEIYAPRVRQLIDLKNQGYTDAEWKGCEGCANHKTFQNHWHGYGVPTKLAVNRTRSWYLKKRDDLVDQIGQPDKSTTIHDFGDGWTIKHLQTVGDARYEGSLMKNCINKIGKNPCWTCNAEDYSNDEWKGRCTECEGEDSAHCGVCDGSGKCNDCGGSGYHPDGASVPIGHSLMNENEEHPWVDDDYHGRIYSLRDPDNIPHVSFTMTDQADSEGGLYSPLGDEEGINLSNLYGKTNKPPKKEDGLKVAQFFKDYTKDKPGTHTVDAQTEDDRDQAVRDGGFAGGDHITPNEAIHVFGGHEGTNTPWTAKLNCGMCKEDHENGHNPENAKFCRTHAMGWQRGTDHCRGVGRYYESNPCHSKPVPEENKHTDLNCPECMQPRLFAASAGDTTDPTRVTQTPNFIPPTPRGKDPWKDVGDSGLPEHNPALQHDPKLKRMIMDQQFVGPTQANVAAENETSWHLTQNPHFALDPEHNPQNNTTLGGDWPEKGIFLGDPAAWFNGHDYVRPFAAEISHPRLDDMGGYSGEKFLPAEHFDKSEVKRVIPIDEYVREQYHNPGWIETYHRTTAQGEPTPKDFPSDYRYTGPDVRDMSKGEVNNHLRRMNEYIKGSRPHMLICKNCAYPKSEHHDDGWAWKDFGEHPFKSPGPFYKATAWANVAHEMMLPHVHDNDGFHFDEDFRYDPVVAEAIHGAHLRNGDAKSPICGWCDALDSIEKKGQTWTQSDGSEWAPKAGPVGNPRGKYDPWKDKADTGELILPVPSGEDVKKWQQGPRRKPSTEQSVNAPQDTMKTEQVVGGMMTWLNPPDPKDHEFEAGKIIEGKPLKCKVCGQISAAHGPEDIARVAGAEKTAMALLNEDEVPPALADTIREFKKLPNVHRLENPGTAAMRCGPASYDFADFARSRGHKADVRLLRDAGWQKAFKNNPQREHDEYQGSRHAVPFVDGHYVDWTARQYNADSPVPRIYKNLKDDDALGAEGIPFRQYFRGNDRHEDSYHDLMQFRPDAKEWDPAYRNPRTVTCNKHKDDWSNSCAVFPGKRHINLANCTCFNTPDGEEDLDSEGMFKFNPPFTVKPGCPIHGGEEATNAWFANKKVAAVGWGWVGEFDAAAAMKRCPDCRYIGKTGPFQEKCPECGGTLELVVEDKKKTAGTEVDHRYHDEPDLDCSKCMQEIFATRPNFLRPPPIPYQGPKGPRGRTALFDYDPVRDVQTTERSAPAPSAQGSGGDPWPDQGDNGTAPPRPGWIRDPKLKKWVRDEQLTYPDVGPTFPGVTDVNQIAAGRSSAEDVGAYNWVRWIEDDGVDRYIVTAAACPKHKREKSTELPEFSAIRTHGVKQCYFCGKSDLVNRVKAQAVPQQPADYDADNGIDGPLDRPKSWPRGRKLIQDGQVVAPDNGEWNVSVDNQTKTGSTVDTYNELKKHAAAGRDIHVTYDPKGDGNERTVKGTVSAMDWHHDGAGGAFSFMTKNEEGVYDGELQIPYHHVRGIATVEKTGQAQPDSEQTQQPAPKLTDLQMHVIDQHSRVVEEYGAALAEVPDGELEEAHIMDHATGWNTHNPEVLKVARDSNARD